MKANKIFRALRGLIDTTRLYALPPAAFHIQCPPFHKSCIRPWGGIRDEIMCCHCDVMRSRSRSFFMGRDCFVLSKSVLHIRSKSKLLTCHLAENISEAYCVPSAPHPASFCSRAVTILQLVHTTYMTFMYNNMQ